MENATAKQVVSVVMTSVLEDASELAKSAAGSATPFHRNNSIIYNGRLSAVCKF